MARFWGDKGEVEGEGEQPSAGPSPIEKAILGMVASNPQVQEAIKALLGMVQQYTQEQSGILSELKIQRQTLGEIKLMLLRQGMAQPGAHVQIEGMVSDGTRCPICNTTEACECFATPPEQAGGDNGQA